MPSAPADHLEAFRKHIEIERGLACWPTYRYQLQGYMRFLDTRSVDLLNATRDDVVAYLEEKKRAGLKASTLFLASVSIRLFHRFLVASGRAVGGPVDLKLPKFSHRLPQPLNLEEIEHLLSIPTGCKFHRIRLVAALQLAFATGLRASELTGLQLDDINFTEGWIRVRRPKNDRDRIVPVGEKTKTALASYLKVRNQRFPNNAHHIFLTSNGCPWSRGAFWWQLRKLAKEAGIVGRVHPHGIRHAFGAILTARGVGLRTIQENLGHRQIATTQIYTRIAPEEIREALQSAHPNF